MRRKASSLHGTRLSVGAILNFSPQTVWSQCQFQQETTRRPSVDAGCWVCECMWQYIGGMTLKGGAAV